MPPIALILFAVVGLVAVVIVINIMAQKKRREAWRRVATDLGLAYYEKGGHLLGTFGQLKLFEKGRSRKLTNVIVGDAGDVQITLGDYCYTTGSGKNSHTHHQTICILTADALGLPHCFLRPEVRFFDFLGGLLGGQDLDFDDDADFSAAYVLQGEDEAAIRGLFDAETRAWFSAKGGQNFHFESAGDTLMFHTGRRVGADHVRELMEQALQVKKLLER